MTLPITRRAHPPRLWVETAIKSQKLSLLFSPAPAASWEAPGSATLNRASATSGQTQPSWSGKAGVFSFQQRTAHQWILFETRERSFYAMA